STATPQAARVSSALRRSEERRYFMSNDISAKNVQEAIGTILAKLCYPAADEIGSGFGDKISVWRQRNAIKVLRRAEKMLPQNESQHAPPRLVHEIVENGSWVDDPLIQDMRSEEHTSELQSRENLVCRLLLEKKKK